ncbi:MAG: TonB-dependent receptor, partial [Novosphingobium sp.]|nr:TonB-dependent receptor [Novosphingobium sp.]
MKKILAALLAGTALGCPQLALAQDAEAPAGEGGLEEIVVTAQKRSEGISRVPISIAAVSGEKLAAMGTANMEQVASSVPNLRITQTGIANRISIRGISSGDNKGFEQSAAMFIDGIYYGRDQLIRMPIVDVQRIEVLRGPQPTLFGKNAIAGAISVVNREPGGNTEVQGIASYEFEHRETQLTGVVNVPFSDNAGMRVVGYYRKLGGYMFNSTLNRDEPQNTTYFFRGTLKAESGPIAASLKMEYADFKTLGQARENFTARGAYSTNPFFSSVDTNLDWRSQNNGFDSRTKVFNTTLGVKIEAGEHSIDLTSGYVHYSAKELLDVDYIQHNILDATNQAESYDQLSQEVRLTSPDNGKFKYIVGGYFQSSRLSAEDYVIFGSFMNSLPMPFRVLADTRSERQFKQTSELWSAFAQGTLSITEQLRITAGVRFNSESKSGDRNLVIVKGPTNIFPIANVRAVWSALRVVDHSISGSFTENSTTPMANIQFDVTPELMLYGSYARGVKAGGFDIRSNALPTTPGFPGAFQFRPEKADNFEGGLKYKSRNVQLALSYYRTKYKDLQTNVFDGGIGFNVNNASAAKVQGVEAEARVGIGSSLQLSGSLAYLDFKYTDWRQGQCPFGFTPNVAPNFCDYTGASATFAPKWSGSAAIDFNQPVGDNMKFTANVNVDYSSRYRAGNVLDTFTEQAPYAKLGARIAVGADDGQWEIALVGRNLTNQRILLTGGQLPLSTTLTGNTGVAYTGIFDRTRN